ncbi:hypothetical protein F4777DRAFT_106430 [Nemania sp. FL0916]|nr:hypothetical protein F4777DRAFT_106430 [Nemania sp. FL0916]
MAEGRHPSLGRKRGRNWISRVVRSVPLRLGRVTLRNVRRIARRDKPQPEDACRDIARRKRMQKDSFKVSSGKTLQNPKPTGDSTLSNTKSEIDRRDQSFDIKSVKPVKPVSRGKNMTFPQSRKEKEKRIVSSTSPDERPKPAGTEGRNITGERSREYFQNRDNWEPPRRDNDTLDHQLKAFRAAIREGSNWAQETQASNRFVEIWESQLLSRIEKVLDQVDCEYTVNVVRSSEPGNRIIVIMTAVVLSNDVESELRKTKTESLPRDLDSTTTVVFHEGTIGFLTGSETMLSKAPSSTGDDDSCISPQNTARHIEPAIGDSVGWHTETATLGPLLQIGPEFYRLVCWHLFDDNKGDNYYCDEVQPPSGLHTVHPSRSDFPIGGVDIGTVVAYSGPMYKTSRPSISITSEFDPEVVTDWALIALPESAEEVQQMPRRNIVRRRAPNDPSTTLVIEITQSRDPASIYQEGNNGADGPLPLLVYSIGRTSGYTTGQLGLIYGLSRLADGRKTMNWAVSEEHESGLWHERNPWISGGMGIPGDSGAGVFGFWDNDLLGQIWGRNAYKRSDAEPRIALFTAFTDICADIQERIPGSDLARLPALSPPHDSILLDRRRDTHEAMWVLSDHAHLTPISETLDESDISDDHNLKPDDVRRSAAKSRRLKGIVDLGRRANLLGSTRYQQLRNWAGIRIHAATF